jgi:signal transduction histidine kinase
MKLRPVLSDAAPIVGLIAFQSVIGFTVAWIDRANGAASPNATYAAAVQAAAASIYLSVRLIRRAKERAAVAAAARDPLVAPLPPASSSASCEWRALAEAQRATAARLLAERDAAARNDLDAFVMAVHAMKAPVAALGLLAERAESTGVPLRPLDVKLEAEEMDRLLEQALGRIRLVDFERDALVERFDLRDAAASAVRRARRLFIARGIAVALDEVGLEAETDRKWLTFILDQLTVNAAKYASRTVVVRFQALGQALVVRIEDDGPGIHKEDLDRLGSRSFVGASGRRPTARGCLRRATDSIWRPGRRKNWGSASLSRESGRRHGGRPYPAHAPGRFD